MDGGQYLFLDMEWLSNVLKPVLDHKVSQLELAGHLGYEASDVERWNNDLLTYGILRHKFAVVLWQEVIRDCPKEEDVVKELCGVLEKLGLVIPRARDENGLSGGYSDLLVIMRLESDCPCDMVKRLEDFHKYMGEGRRLKLQWKFDAEAPYGLIERLVVSCRVLGHVHLDGYWRRGALFTSPAADYAFLAKYEEKDDDFG